MLKKEGSWCSSLVFSKARVAPLKPLTLPRLELLAALMCARLLEFVRDALQLPSDVSSTCWTDSTVVLAWVKSDPSRWKTFVCNRVAEIQSLSNPAHWRHCPGSLNPADLASRGISGEELVKSNLWLHGPDFLQEDGDEPEFDCMSSKALVDSVCDLPSLDLEAKQGYAVMSSVRVEPLLDFTRYSDFCSVLRVVGWVCRFVHNLRVQKVDRVSGDLTLEELQGAKTLIFRITQETDFSEEILSVQKGHRVSKKSSLFKLLPFLDDEGLLRVRGRLQFSDIPLSSKHPVILPNCHLSLLYIRFLHHFLKHAGVNTMLVRLREEFWVIGARRLCKRVRRECLPCKRLDAKAGDQPVPPLPRLRVSKAPPFSVTGLDHGGPLFCLDCGKKKFYFLLFTCAIVRAVHLELVDSLSAETTLAALRRFISRRGMPSVLMSDNARGFVAAKDLVVQYFGSEGPTWRFIVPRAPWWGGWWERLIGSVKSGLRRSIGKRSLTHIELETNLFEIEACINSRPLTFVGDDLDSSAPLTPSHFLIGRASTKSVEVEADFPITKNTLSSLHNHRQQVLDHFWLVWSEEYIRNLPSCARLVSGRGGLKVGAVVLIRDENRYRLKWPMGVVVELFPGRDGLVRSAKVKTTRGFLVRQFKDYTI